MKHTGLDEKFAEQVRLINSDMKRFQIKLFILAALLSIEAVFLGVVLVTRAYQ